MKHGTLKPTGYRKRTQVEIDLGRHLLTNPKLRLVSGKKVEPEKSNDSVTSNI